MLPPLQVIELPVRIEVTPLGRHAPRVSAGATARAPRHQPLLNPQAPTSRNLSKAALTIGLTAVLQTPHHVRAYSTLMRA